MLGHGLARALSGDYEAAAVSIHRAMALDADVLGRIPDDPTLREAIEGLRDRLHGDEGDEAYLLSVLEVAG